MYNEKVMDLFKNPKNVGELPGANAVGKVGNEACGDIMQIFLKINDNEIIEDASFKTFGCAAAIVSSSVACDIIKGKSIEEALKLENQEIIDYLGGLPTHKIHCSVLAKEAIEDAISNYRKKQAKAKK
ncbi:MAG: iron-sulfur cluster assembly scaffold protein [Clostridiales bacterium]|nr:iron-sulfur cluster assembly scaffold protein [Clostridiales bacterium]